MAERREFRLVLVVFLLVLNFGGLVGLAVDSGLNRHHEDQRLDQIERAIKESQKRSGSCDRERATLMGLFGAGDVFVPTILKASGCLRTGKWWLDGVNG